MGLAIGATWVAISCDEHLCGKKIEFSFGPDISRKVAQGKKWEMERIGGKEHWTCPNCAFRKKHAR